MSRALYGVLTRVCLWTVASLVMWLGGYWIPAA